MDTTSLPCMCLGMSTVQAITNINRTHISTHAYTHSCTHAYVHTYMDIHTHTHTCIHAYKCTTGWPTFGVSSAEVCLLNCLEVAASVARPHIDAAISAPRHHHGPSCTPANTPKSNSQNERHAFDFQAAFGTCTKLTPCKYTQAVLRELDVLADWCTDIGVISLRLTL